MTKSAIENNAKIFAEYIADKKVLIADCSGSSRAGLAKLLITLGAKTSNIAMAPTYDVAQDAMKKMSPHVVITEYDLGNRCGLDLLQAQRAAQAESKKSLFILVTSNTSQSAVAQAAEEDVDTFILKPYTLEVLRQAIFKAANAKLTPSEYVKAIEAGKTLLFDGKPDEALVEFEKAKTLDPRPALAFFYHGQAELMKKAMEPAEESFNKGLIHNKIHYKCMVGLYDLQMEKKLYKEAYDLVKRISRYFPANPQRLSSVLRLAVMTQSYEDIERYYQIFIDLDARNEELIKYICAALVVCGKFYLQKNFGTRATELFQKAAVTAGGRTKILREIVLALAQHELTKDALEFLKRFPPQSHTGVDYITCELLANDGINPPALTIDAGRKIIAQDIHDPSIYKVLVKRSIETGLNDYAENLKSEGVKRWPNMRDEFVRIANETPIPEKPAPAPEAEKKAA